MPAKRSREDRGERSRTAPAERAAAARRSALELLDGARTRQRALDPDGDAEAFVYFSHLSALTQLTDLFFREALKPHQLSLSEHRVLGALRSRGRDFRATPHALNRFTQITSAGMTSTLDRLERRGLVSRAPNPEDRRSVLIGLTDEGWAFSESVSRAVGERFAAVVASMKKTEIKAEIESLRGAVERLADSLFED